MAQKGKMVTRTIEQSRIKSESNAAAEPDGQWTPL